MKFTILGKPFGKQRPRFSGSASRAYTPGKTKEYENWVKICFRSAKQKPLQGQLVATIQAYYPIPKSYTKAQRAAIEAGELRPTTKPDLDNVAKAILDALNEEAYKDDAHIVDLFISKHYSTKPRCEVSIEEVIT